MNPQSFGALAAFLAVLIWVVSRRKPTPFASLDASAVAALNRAQISLVQQKVERSSPTPAVSWPLPADPRQQAAFLKTLQDQLAGDTGQRLAAMQAARAWGHRITLPLLKRGLRDANLEVVQEAAQAMERFRGRSTPVLSLKPQPRLPRNAALTR
jgi:HEAT repeat protein